jgi:hypothetical protein
MGKFLTKTFSGYRRDWDEISGGFEGFKLTVLDARTNERWDLTDNLNYWMSRPIYQIFQGIEQTANNF